MYYHDVPFNEEGWVSVVEWLPYPFDVVTLKAFSESLERDKVFNGWWTGKEWEGLRLKEKDKVNWWRRKT